MVQYFDDKVRRPRLHKVENRIVCFNHQVPLRFAYQSAPTLKYLYEGEIEYELNGQLMRLSAGHFLLMKRAHHLKTYIRQSARGVALFFSSDARLDERTYGERLLMPLIQSPLKTVLEKIGTQYTVSAKEDDWQDNVIEAMEDYNRMLVRYGNCLGYKRNKTKEDVLSRVLMGRQYLENNFRMPVSLDETARFAGLSKYLFIRKFTEVFELSPYQFLLNLRIEAAKEMITDNTSSLTAIAEYCGFSNLHHFSKMFKKYTGMAPSQYEKGLPLHYEGSPFCLELQTWPRRAGKSKR